MRYDFHVSCFSGEPCLEAFIAKVVECISSPLQPIPRCQVHPNKRNTQNRKVGLGEWHLSRTGLMRSESNTRFLKRGGCSFVMRRSLHNQGSSRDAAVLLYSAFLVASLVDFGTVISVIRVLLASMSAAHRAAPTGTSSELRQRLLEGKIGIPVFVKENRIDANGISSSNVATVPNLHSSQDLCIKRSKWQRRHIG